MRPAEAPPPAAGIGLRAAHYAEVIDRRPALAFVEVHSENFFGDGGPALAWLGAFREIYPLSLHGVGLSLGSADPLDELHLARLERLVRRFEPALVSDHLCWTSVGGRHAHDLLPLPFTEEALAHVVARIQAVQERLGRRILVENVASYVELADGAVPEWEFFAEVARRAGCGLLLDVSNIWVSASNHGFDPARYLESVPDGCVEEIHVAGFEPRGALLVDTHGAPVAPETWRLYDRAIERLGARPTIVEWDVNLPALEVLLEEAARADAILEGADRRAQASAEA